jgi:hypothetical protein
MHHITDRLKQVIIFITNFKQQFVRLHVSFIIIATHVNFCNIFFSPKNKSGIEKLKLIRAQVFSFSGLSQKICKNTEIPIFVPRNIAVFNEFRKFSHLLFNLMPKFFFDKLAFSKSNALLQNFSNTITTGPLHRTTTRRVKPARPIIATAPPELP